MSYFGEIRQWVRVRLGRTRVQPTTLSAPATRLVAQGIIWISLSFADLVSLATQQPKGSSVTVVLLQSLIPIVVCSASVLLARRLPPRAAHWVFHLQNLAAIAVIAQSFSVIATPVSTLLLAIPLVLVALFDTPGVVVPYVVVTALADFIGHDVAPTIGWVADFIEIAGAYVAIGAVLSWGRRQLVRLTHLDSLCQIANRAGFLDYAERELIVASRAGTPLALAMIDLDRFKLINDVEGHEAGDALLRRLADTWRVHLDGRMLLARLGGDEFVIVAPGLHEAQLSQVVQQLAEVGGHPFSYGLAEFEEDDEVGNLLRRADLAMLVMKSTRRLAYGAPSTPFV